METCFFLLLLFSVDLCTIKPSLVLECVCVCVCVCVGGGGGGGGRVLNLFNDLPD